MLDSQFAPLLIVFLIIWSLAWKGIALWKAARQEQKAWFVALLAINTLGLLEIIYLLFFQKKPTWEPPLGKERS